MSVERLSRITTSTMASKALTVRADETTTPNRIHDGVLLSRKSWFVLDANQDFHVKP